MKIYSSKELSSPENKALFEELILLVAHAFTEDACTQYLFSNHSRASYVADLKLYKRFLMRLAILSDASFIVITKDEAPPSQSTEKKDEAAKELQIQLPADATIRAVGVVIPPHGNANFDSMITILRAGGITLPFRFGLGFIRRLLFDFLPGIGTMHDTMFPEPKTKYNNWHLFYLATHPDNQGQGLGKRILTEVQETVRRYNKVEGEKARASGRTFVPAPLYLEASNANNKRLYNRVGFEDRTTMVYGNLDCKDDNSKTDENGKVLGGRLFGMVWPQ